MLKVNISTAIFLYLFFNVILVLGYWLFSGYKRKEIVLRSDNDYMWKCHICANVYVDSKDDEFSKCPQCETLLKKNRY
ncbi:MAG: hypothetical protein PHQ52_01070 [Candidatus Omnitrophica bacterium]|nr:hypothetical protein [Candidatus Omnitrophota bacterium]